MTRIQAALNPVWLIVQRELRDYLRDWRMLLPSLILTVGFPFLMNGFTFVAVNFVNRYGANLVVERLVPISILIIGFFPLTTSLLAALESFVGEKERGTIEPLLSTPLEDWQLYLGKLIVSTLLPLTSSFLSILIYIVLIAYQRMVMPSILTIVQLLLLTVSHAVLMVSAAIVISTQSTSIKGANLLASFIVIPVAILMQGETFLLFWGNEDVIWLGVLAVLVMAALIVRLGLAHFQREYLLGREIDMLHVSWLARTFWKYFKGETCSVIEWYRILVAESLKKAAYLVLMLALLSVVSIVASYLWAQQELSDHVTLLLPESRMERIERLRGSFLSASGIEEPFYLHPWFLFFHNLRAVLIAAFFGLFSFGVLNVVLYMLNTSVIGVVLGIFNLLGYSPLPIALAGILPHGIFELPALILSCAILLRAGIVLVTPQAQRTIGEVLLDVVADWMRVMIGVVIPLLLIAALVESYLTPYLLLRFVSFP